jgi:hypothetical protein
MKRVAQTGALEAGIIGASFFLKAGLLNVSLILFILIPDFTTDLFVETPTPVMFLFCVLIVNSMAFLFCRAFLAPIGVSQSTYRLDRGVNLALALGIAISLAAAFVVFEQKILNFSSSMALLGIAFNSRLISLIAFLIFLSGVPEALILDEYIPLVFCGLINFYVFLPWLKSRGTILLFLFSSALVALIVLLADYYVSDRYDPFKLFERIYEQAAPMSWPGSALRWFQPNGILEGMPSERVVLVVTGEWNAQFQVTYLIANSPILGALFLLVGAHLVGRFGARSLNVCRDLGSNVLTNFLRLKVLLLLIEILGEKVSQPGKLIGLVVLLFLSERLFSWMSRSAHRPDFQFSRYRPV